MTIELPQFHPQLGQPSKVFPYRDEGGKVLAAVYRFDTREGKTIRPFDLLTGQWKAPEVRPLYELEFLKESSLSSVVLVEGEKCVDALLKQGFLSTTSMGGSNAAHKTDWSALKGRDVIIWPDNDEAGMLYAHAAARELLKVGANVRLIDIHKATLRNVEEQSLRICIGNVACNDTYTNGPIGDVCPKGWDVADAIEDGFPIGDIQSILDQAEPYRDNTDAFPKGNLPPANDNWPNPDLSFLNAEISPPRFPVEVFPPSLAAWVNQTAESKSAPIDYVAATLLTASASLIGSSRNVSPWQGWKETPVLWSALVGSPSSGKSPAMDPILSVMRHLEGHYGEDHASALREYETNKLEAELEKQKWERAAKDAQDKGVAPPLMPERAVVPIKPQSKRLIIRDTTVEALAMALQGQPKGILTYRDELAGWFASFDRYSGARGGDRAFWLEAFGARPYTVDRVKNGEPVIIPYLASSILGGIQPDRLESCLMKGDDDGLSARFMYFFPDQVKRQRPRFVPEGMAIEGALIRLAKLEHDSVDGKAVPRTVTLDTGASDRFESWWSEMQMREPNGRLSGWWGKLPGMVLRLALVLHYLDWASKGEELEPTTLSVSTVSAAIGLVETYLAPMAERAHGLAAQQEVDQHAVLVADHIRGQSLQEFTVRDLQRSGPMRSLAAEEIKSAVNRLVGYGWLRAAPIRQGDTPGKRKARYLVNQLIRS